MRYTADQWHTILEKHIKNNTLLSFEEIHQLINDRKEELQTIIK